jgi:predicted DsbA family dithiol-disulfide isomerase
MPGNYFSGSRSQKELRMRTIFGCIFFLVLVSMSQNLHGQDNKPGGARELGSVDGVVITETQVRNNGAGDLDSLELQALKAKAVLDRNEHEILEKSLDQLIGEKLLQSEAAKRGITKEQLLAAEVKSGVKEPTDEEVDSFYKSNAQRIQKPKEEVVPQIVKYLKTAKEISLREAFVERLEKEHRVNRLLEPLRFGVEAADRPSQGSASAPVTVVVFSDFQCPYCKAFSATLKQAAQKYGDKIRLVFRQFPLTAIHPNAQKAAEASLCAAGQQKFWEMHDLLFQNQSYLSVQDLKNRADRLGLDVTAFNACLDGGKSAAIVHEDLAAGFRAGAEGTPASFVNGRFIGGNVPLDELSALIDDELGRKSSRTETRAQ